MKRAVVALTACALRRGVLVVVLGWALGACAAQPAVRRAPSIGEPVYDAAQEWQRENALPAPPPPVVPRPAFDVDLQWSSWTTEPLDVSVTQLSRIRSVQPFVYAAARTHAVPADLVNGIIWVESRFQVDARSSKGPCGLMQLMPHTAREIAPAIGMPYQPYDPEFNINAGTYYFARLVERFAGDLTLALAAYNIGPGTVTGWLRDSQPLPVVSRTYVDNVFTAARFFRASPP